MLKTIQQIIHECEKQGIHEFCVCAGARNAALVYALDSCSHAKIYYWFEERSAAFFALGRSRATKLPVAVITTSGTAVGELLPAAMEAHYTHTPLLFITADRPRRFRGTGAPQSAEQVNIFGHYTELCLDIEEGETFTFNDWKKERPLHLNICFEEPRESDLKNLPTFSLNLNKDSNKDPVFKIFSTSSIENFTAFYKAVDHPLVILGALPTSTHESLIPFLRSLNAPIYAESTSGLRENQELSHLKIHCIDQAWELSKKNGYPINGVLRIGGIPTARLWRDLEEKYKNIPVLSISHLPFSGLSRLNHSNLIHTCLKQFFKEALHRHTYESSLWSAWQSDDSLRYLKIIELLKEEPLSELSFMHKLSKAIPPSGRIYLGNSLPIREWDFIATQSDQNYEIGASRGLNGIDGQISTFLGWSQPERSNWAILGDLTTLYDMAAPWILPQITSIEANIVVMNNGGGKIFTKLFSNPIFYNCHHLEFSHLAAMWNLPYTKWEHAVPGTVDRRSQLIEIVPSEEASLRLEERIKEIFLK
jgi:2-succinyl-5-enolpyruvyl-6-hydroxy-3-cyclohexene-1-carboxylate synthase